MTVKGIHEDQGRGHDEKYSKWRREVFPDIANRRNCYCTDLDWVEWRNGNPKALIECRRTMGSQSLASVIEGFKTKQNGFQLEVLARLAHEAGAKAYLVAIQDSNPSSADYSAATFRVVEVIPPNPWPKSNPVGAIKFGPYENMNEEDYVSFISRL